MAKWFLSMGVVATLLLRIAFANDARDVVQRGKAATAFLESADGKSTATAVCIDKAGIFITSQHVVKGLSADAKLKLVLNPNDESRREVQAVVVRQQAEDDLAVLRVDGQPQNDFAFLPIGSDSKLFETMSVTSFGFPFGKVLAVKDQKEPDISVNVGRITALRKREGKLRQIQLDAQLNPGNSGGPVVDDEGAIVAIVQSGVFATGVNFAVPVSALRSLLEKPDVVFETPKIESAKKEQETQFRVKLIPFLEPLKNPLVELELSQQGRETRTFTAVADGENQYLVAAVPVPAIKSGAPIWVGGNANFSQGAVKGDFLDQAFRVDQTSLQLADILIIKPGDPCVVSKHDGTELRGQCAGLDQVQVNLGGQLLRIDLSKAQRVDLRPAEQLDPTVHYKLSIKDADIQLAEVSGTIAIEGLIKMATSAGQIAFTPYAGERQVIELPDTIANAVWAGGGRYLVLHLQKTRKLAIYDVNAAKVTRYLSLGSDNALIAGGLDKLIVVAPGESLIERWSLQSFEKETAQRLPIKGIVKNAALGYASHGPLLLHAAASTDQLAAAGPALLKLTNFEEIKVKGFNSRNGSFRDHIHIRASGTGDVFGSWCTSHSPQGLEVAVLMGDTVKMAYQHDSVGHVVPNFDGSAVLTGIAGVFTPELTNKRERSQGMMPGIPSTHPRFYVSVPTEPAAQRNLGGQPFAGRKAAVHVLGLDAAIVDLPELGLGQPAENYSWSANDFTLDKRVMFVPQADQVVSIPYTNDRLIVQRFNVIEALDAAKVDYLFVRSTPPRTFKKIEMYRYEIEVASRAGGVQYELSSGPPGMELSSTGVLQWKPPLDFAESNVSVIVTIKNAQGQSVYDSFTLKAQ